MTTNEIEKNVRELQRAIVTAQLSYEIWWVYKEKDSRARFTDVLNDYPLYFRMSIHAHFVAMIIALYRLYETRKDTFNLQQLIRLLKKQNKLTIEEIKNIESNINSAKLLWQKVSLLRNNIFAHQSSKFDGDEIWERANVTPNEFKELIDETKAVLNIITHLWDRRGHAFNLSATHDVVKLLEDLKRLNAHRP